MKKYRILISLLGFVLQILFLYFMARKFAYWQDIGQYYMIFSLAVLLYNAFIDKKSSLKQYCRQLFVGIIIAVVLSSLIVALETIDIVLLLVLGIVTAALVITVVFHVVHLVLPGGLKEKGLGNLFEISLTFFSFVLYPMLIYFSLTVIEAIILVVIVFLISLLAAYLISIPLKRSAQSIAHVIKEWQSTTEIPDLQITVFKKIIDVLNEFTTRIRNSYQNLTNMGTEIKTSSEDLSSVSEQMNASLQEVSSTVQQISKGAQEQSSSITSIAKSIEGLNNLTTSISSQVKMASVSSRRTTNSAKHGMDLSKKEAKLSKEIFEQTKFIENKMAELLEQSGEIKKIIDIIAGITEQTDLLALNAAIEAARVGEQGRGFAVVADEIRNLATETQRSSAVVENLISEINKTVQELSNLLTSEREKMNESNALAAQTEEEFTGIVKAVDLITDMISRINQAAADQSANTKDLVKQVEQIAQVATDTAASTEEVSAAVEEQTASMQQFTSTAQVLASFAKQLDELLLKLKE
jgi:methyl-accepting chemotaxis protein